MTVSKDGLTLQERVEILPCREEDLAEIAAIEAASFSEPWSEQGFRDALQLGESAKLFSAKAGDDLLGYLVLYITPESGEKNPDGSPGRNYFPGERELETTAVAKGYRGLGIGHKLIGAMKSYAYEHGILTIFLEVRVSNEAARALYISEGFIECGMRKGFYRFPDEDAIVMKWEASLD